MTEINDIRKYQLETLLAVHNFCEEKGIQYFIAGGSLIGAIRHGGYIPWDDDIDICMRRNEYDQFLESFIDDKYKIATYYNTKNYFYPFAKVYDSHTYLNEMMLIDSKIGIGIDVFPIDNLCDDDIINQRNYKKVRFYRNIIAGKIFWLSGINPVKRFCIRFISRFANGKRTAMKIEAIAKKYKDVETKRIGHIVWGYSIERDMLPNYAYNDSFQIKFENITVNCPKEYDLILKTNYGDYMCLPPKEEQQSTHHFKAYIKESEDNHD